MKLLTMGAFIISVRLDPNVTYGAVQLWSDNKYHLICADGFDDMAAKVVCGAMGYRNGISVCCSAFGDMDLPITYHNVSCTGKESWILGCSYKTGPNGCPSKKYASVTCSDAPASGGKEISIFKTCAYARRMFIFKCNVV